MKRIAFNMEIANLLEESEPGKHIVTRDGRPVRIVCTNLAGDFPFVGKYTTASGDEITIQTSKDGLCSLTPNCQDDDDLFLLVEEPKFKVGDTIRAKSGGSPITILRIDDYYYRFINGYMVSIESQDDWEIVDPSGKGLTEFEQTLQSILDEAEDRITPKDNDFIKKVSAELLSVASKEIKKDLPKWKKTSLDTGQTTLIRADEDFLQRNGYTISLKELDKLEKVK